MPKGLQSAKRGHFAAISTIGRKRIPLLKVWFSIHKSLTKYADFNEGKAVINGLGVGNLSPHKADAMTQ